MRNRVLAIWGTTALTVITSATWAQEKKPIVENPVRVTVTLTEFEGTKILSTLPYDIPCPTAEAKMKIGYRIPYVSKPQAPVEFQDIGTMLDCFARPRDSSGVYILQLKVEHLSVYPARQNSSSPVEWHPGDPLPEDPIFGQVVGEFHDLVLRDGKTVEPLTATDPVSGHTWKVTVTLNAVK
jgi:hypothetical protein